MERDEASTIEVLILCHDGMKGLAQKHDGSVVDTAGDGFLLEFMSAEDAVRFALDFQKAVRAASRKVRRVAVEKCGTCYMISLLASYVSMLSSFQVPA